MIEHYMIEPARFKLDGGAMYGIIPKPLWNKVHPADELNRVDLALRLWLIKTANRVILVDTGIGDYHGSTFDQRFDVQGGENPINQALSSLSLSTDDITDLVISHLHFDHVGGIGIKNAQGEMTPVFKNATCHVHQQHYEYALKPTDRDTGSFHRQIFEPILEHYRKDNKLTLYQGEEGLLFDLEDNVPLSFKCSFGHTPWLMHPYTPTVSYTHLTLPTKRIV